MSWPGHINDVGGIRRQFHHVIDIVPTILEATGIPAPDMINGIKQHPIEGVSMAYTWDKANANAPTRHTNAILRDAWQSRHLSRRVGGGDDAGDSAMGAEHQGRLRM
jgi:arylsulfatase A-like enzyme